MSISCGASTAGAYFRSILRTACAAGAAGKNFCTENGGNFYDFLLIVQPVGMRYNKNYENMRKYYVFLHFLKKFKEREKKDGKEKTIFFQKSWHVPADPKLYAGVCYGSNNGHIFSARGG